MDRVQHRTSNGVLSAPPGVPPEKCVAIPVTNVLFADGVKGRITYWRPTAQELRLIANGASVRLCVLGVAAHPQVLLGVEGDGFGQVDGVKL